MTGKPTSDREALRRLADALADDVLNTSDQEVLAEAAEEYGDTKQLAANMRALFERTCAAAGKAKLAAARAALNGDRRRAPSRRRLDPSAARRLLQQVLTAHPETAQKLTYAARRGEGLSDEDVFSMLDDLEELGVIPCDPQEPLS